jgi:hypothetical protein
MCHVHSADGRRLNHLAGGVPVHSVDRQYARAAAYTVLIMARALPRKQRRISILYALRTWWRSEIFWGAPALDTSICIPSVLPLGPHVGAQHPCMCPPWVIKGRAPDVTRQTDLDPAKARTLTQAQYITQWSRVLRSGGPNHSKPLCVLVFFPIPSSSQNA